MSWRVNVVGMSFNVQLGMNWGFCIGLLIFVLLIVWMVVKMIKVEEELGYCLLVLEGKIVDDM